LNVLSGSLKCDEGLVKIGLSVKIGYFTQHSTELKDNQTVLGTLKEIAEYIDVGEGRERYLTTRDLLEKFLFPHKQHNAFISTLSGGERRRLQLLKVFMTNPNVLLLDEPTNDLDIPTLHALEDYLQDFFGVLLIVSHDRAFLDRTVNMIYSFEANGKIKEYPGNYSYYLELKESNRVDSVNSGQSQKHLDYKESQKNKGNQKLSFKEQFEFDKLENEINELEINIADLDTKIKSTDLKDYSKLEQMSNELVRLQAELDSKFERWSELGDKY
jgi:ATP-binding cassette subfamily F protein uup